MPDRTARRRPTIADVAALAGVSKGAVSRSFNGGERISAATRERIHDAARQLNWAPNAAARAVNGAPAHAIGVVVQRSPERLHDDPFFASFLSGVESALSARKCAAILRFVSTAAEERDCYDALAAERRVDGFLLSDVRERDPRPALLDRLGLPAVVVGRPRRSGGLPSVDTDSDAAVVGVLEHLVGLGHRSIAHVTGSPELSHTGHRLELYRRTLTRLGVTEGPVVTGDFTADGGAAATRELLAAEEPFTAVFYANDVMAVAGMATLIDAGVRVPQDVSVAGFDDISLASYVTPSLTTVRCDYRQLGRRAADLLLAQVFGTDPGVAPDLTATLEVRRSTAAAPTSTGRRPRRTVSARG